MLAQLVLDLWQWSLNHNLVLEAQHIPGVLNVRADQESRALFDCNDWQLSPVVFNLINQSWGPLDLDLSASHLSTQLPRFVSWRPDPGAEEFDAFSLDWSKVRGYAFPPFTLVGHCLRQVLAQEVSALVLIAPVWQTQPCYPLLLDLCVANPLLIPSVHGLLSMQGWVHPLTNLQLAGWLLSANPTLRQEFQNQLRTYSSQHGGRVLQIPHASAWRKWASWCSEREINPVQADISAILEFLAFEFQSGKAYRTLNVYRSTILMTPFK